jgi:hypothetical protein
VALSEEPVDLLSEGLSWAIAVIVSGGVRAAARPTPALSNTITVWWAARASTSDGAQ